MTSDYKICPGCGGRFPPVAGPRHPYMESSPGCWAAYGEILARLYTEPAGASVLQLTVDAYAAQHPGQPSPQSIQSVARHLISLCLTIERAACPDRVVSVMQGTSQLRTRLVWLEPPWPRGDITVAKLVDVHDPARYRELSRSWAVEVWNAWSAYHTAIHEWIHELNV